MSRLIQAVFVFVVIAFTLGLYCERQLRRPISMPESSFYEVSRGEALSSVSDRLIADSIVTAPAIVFKIYGLLTRYEGTIKAGEYRLTGDLTARSLLKLLRDGRVAQREIAFPEGWNFSQWRQHLLENEFLEHQMGDDSEQLIMKRLKSGANSAEGQFFPDTYLFSRGASDLSILQRAHERMYAVLDKEWAENDTGTVLNNRQELLVLASIVEKETGYEPDRTLIASVFLNRLSKGMKLQSDPTVIYGLREYSGDLKRSHLKLRTPYNTYVIKRLPPTPICNPGLASIQATLNPAASNYLYFVARGDGTSQFSSSLAEHNAAVARYQKTGRVEQYRSSPSRD